MRTSGFLTVAVALFLSGCASINSIHRGYRVDASKGASVLSVDAKQRHLLIVPEFQDGKLERIRMCAEAAPDVFSAYASSLSAGLGIGATERSARFSNSIAETAATVERTQTINLLRESMYRTCERYLSGALTDDQFIIQAARDQRSMVAVLAIEQLTGAVRAQPTIISGPATSASIVDGKAAAELIERFRVEEEAAKTRLAAADTAYESAMKAGKCDAVAEKPADDAKDPTAAEWTACKGAEAAQAQRREELKAATGRLDKALTLAADFVDRSNASTTAGTNRGAAHTIGLPGDAALIAVAQAVENIVMSPGIDEPLMFCIAYFHKKGALDPDMAKSCVKIISERASDDRLRQRSMIEVANPARYRSALGQGTRMNQFRRLLFARIDVADPSTLSRKMAAFEAAAGTDHGLAASCASSRDSCKQAVMDSDLLESFLADEALLWTALESWNHPESREGSPR